MFDRRTFLKILRQLAFCGMLLAGCVADAAERWDAEHFRKIKAFIKTPPSVDMDRIYILGHSMGGHGTYIFIQLDPAYFAAAAPSAGSGLRRNRK